MGPVICRKFASEGILWHEEFQSDGQSPAGRNWRSFAKHLAQDAHRKTGSAWRVLSLDLRCHGNSSRLPGFELPHTMHQCAGDVVRFVDHQLGGVQPDLLVGHSMGGKVALEYVRRLSDVGTLRGCPVWVLDSQPGLVPADQVPDVQRVLDAVQKVPLPVMDRGQFTVDLKAQGFSDALVQWMASNLVPDPNQRASDARSPAAQSLVWAFDVKGAADLYSSYRSVDSWDVVAAPPVNTRLHVLRAANSDRWTSGMIQKLQDCEAAAAARHSQGTSGHTVGHILDNAGHWVHMDQPKLLRSMIIQYL